MHGNVHFRHDFAFAREFRPVYAASAGSVSLITFDIRHFPDEARVTSTQRKPLQFEYQFGSIWMSFRSMEHPDQKNALVCFGVACLWPSDWKAMRTTSKSWIELPWRSILTHLDTENYLALQIVNPLQFRYGKHWRIKFFVGSTSLAWKDGGLISIWARIRMVETARSCNCYSLNQFASFRFQALDIEQNTCNKTSNTQL